MERTRPSSSGRGGWAQYARYRSSRRAANRAIRSSAETVLNHPETIKLIDFNEPVGVLMLAMIHFLSDEERTTVMGRLRDALAPGSFLAATHVTGDHQSQDQIARVEAVYAKAQTTIYVRSHAEIARFFDGFELVSPGVVPLDSWRPDPSETIPGPRLTSWAYAAVGRKP